MQSQTSISLLGRKCYIERQRYIFSGWRQKFHLFPERSVEFVNSCYDGHQLFIEVYIFVFLSNQSNHKCITNSKIIFQYFERKLLFANQWSSTVFERSGWTDLYRTRCFKTQRHVHIRTKEISDLQTYECWTYLNHLAQKDDIAKIVRSEYRPYCTDSFNSTYRNDIASQLSKHVEPLDIRE